MKVGWKSCIRIGVSAFLLYLCIYYWPAVSGIIGMIFQAIGPLVTGLITAYLLNILMTAYERRYFPRRQHKRFFSKSKKPFCMIGAILTLLGIIERCSIWCCPNYSMRCSCWRLKWPTA